MLYERLLGRNDAGARVDRPITPPLLMAVASEYVRGRLDVAGAQAVLESYHSALDAGELVEMGDLLTTVSGTQAQQLARLQEIESVLLLGRMSAPNYSTPTQIKARLGV
jgi:hypothetical protein